MSKDTKQIMSDTNKKPRYDAKNKKRGPYKKCRKKKNDNPKITIFKGESTDLHGNVFQTFMESKDATQFEKTSKTLQFYVAAED